MGVQLTHHCPACCATTLSLKRPPSPAPSPLCAVTLPLQVATSLLINLLLPRLLIKLGWDAGLISTAGFFGDKGPAYDEEEVGPLFGLGHACLCQQCGASRELELHTGAGSQQQLLPQT